jgi:hypothetical protein
MIKLVSRSPEQTPGEVPLPEGTYRVGRVEGNDLVISHTSVSSRHCELIVGPEGARVRDLGSTNGTFIDGRRVNEATVTVGQTLRFGSVDYLCVSPETNAITARGARVVLTRSEVVPVSAPAETIAAEEAPPLAEGEVPCRNHPVVAARWVCKRCQNLFCEACISTRQSGAKTFRYCPMCRGECADAAVVVEGRRKAGQSFFKALPGVFSYPLHKDGAIFLLAGAVFYAALGFFARFSWIASLIAFGYLCAYVQKLIQSSANGDESLPEWPDLSDFYADIIQPWFLMMWTGLVCFGPLIAYLVFRDHEAEVNPFILFTAMAFGIFYFPMALLAVCMADSGTAVNPLVVLPAILSVPLEYLTACLALLAVVVIRYVSEKVIAFIPIPFLPAFVAGFGGLYFLFVQMRILGLLYYTNRKKFGWYH